VRDLRERTRLHPGPLEDCLVLSVGHLKLRHEEFGHLA
jgi:hypothetical protein